MKKEIKKTSIDDKKLEGIYKLIEDGISLNELDKHLIHNPNKYNHLELILILHKFNIYNYK